MSNQTYYIVVDNKELSNILRCLRKDRNRLNDLLDDEEVNEKTLNQMTNRVVLLDALIDKLLTQKHNQNN